MTLTFQERVKPWLLACFGSAIANDKVERNHRFLEEAIELVQSTGCTASEAHQLVDYVFGRPVGEPAQEAGGVMTTLAALCLANDLDMHEAAEVELKRIWSMVEKIRAKQAAKPKHSPLPAEPQAPAATTIPDEFGTAEHWKEKAQYWAGEAHRLRQEALRGEPVDGIVQPDRPTTIAASLPGTEGFTVAVFKATDVPIGTQVYVKK